MLGASMLLAAGASAAADLYWRVDGGYSMSSNANIRDNNFALDGFICGDPVCNTPGELNDVGNSFVIQGGLGWRLNPNTRVDVTLGYRGSYELDDGDAFPSDFKADITSWALMANGYYDFSLTWGKPYVGAGLGIAMNKIDTITNSGGALAPQSFAIPGGSSSGLAWALMAGISFPLSPTMTLDLGWRYIDLGDIESDAGTIVCTPACGTDPYSGMSGKLRAHELMIGLRF
jgi:opacity protein-like surface antigen